MSKIRVLLADDHAVVRAGLLLLLSGQEDMEVVGEVGDSTLAISEAVRLRPDVVVLDLSMPGQTPEAIATISKGETPARVVVLTMYDDPSHLRNSIASGAAGFVTKSAAGSDLLTAIRSVNVGR